jgi:hypothetical protein
VRALTALALCVLLAGCSDLVHSRTPSAPALPDQAVASAPGCPGSTGSADDLGAENAKPGTEAWRIPSAAAKAPDAPKGYASPFSVTSGDVLSVRVQTNAPAFDAQMYRLGWYRGAGARLVATRSGLAGSRQGPVRVDPETARIDAPWNVSFTLTIPDAWPTGVYLVKLVASTGGEGYAPFVVRSHGSPAPLLVHTSEFTWEAYNTFGGTSLYASNVSGFSRAYEVTLDRPFSAPGWGELPREIPMIQFLEEKGFAVDYASDGDLATRPCLLDHRTGIVTVGHDEYWTAQTRTSLLAALANGTNLAFFGANDGYWHVRLAPSHVDGTPDRTIVCYKSADLDPATKASPAEATVRFQDPPLSESPNQLFGLSYGDQVGYLNTSAGQARILYNLTLGPDAYATFPDLHGLGPVVPGVVGFEWDNRTPDSPPERVLGTGSPIALHGAPSSQQSVLRREPQGGVVFASGSVGWSLGLEREPYDWAEPGDAALRTATMPSPALRALTSDLLHLTSGDDSVLAPGFQW